MSVFAVLGSLAKTVKLVGISVINRLHNNFFPYKIVFKGKFFIKVRGRKK